MVTIYTGALCGYCAMAKRLLQDKGVAFTEIPVDMDPARR
ncbi:MAG TPA: glutaredoxin, partial [Gammaproteobacteria bacterium]|nr:glutaredoxin [Gammaproteobacteria bacterium]